MTEQEFAKIRVGQNDRIIVHHSDGGVHAEKVKFVDFGRREINNWKLKYLTYEKVDK